MRRLCRGIVAFGIFITARGSYSQEPANEASAVTTPAVVVVVGAAGEETYGKQFQVWADRWRQAAEKGGASFQLIGQSDSAAGNDRTELEKTLAIATDVHDQPLWLVLLGHGTFDGKTAKFNLRGPDVSAQELANWLNALERPLAIVNCASSSGPFLNALSGKNRVIITATRSGSEFNFARLGEFLSAALSTLEADLDKDEQVSLLEAFLAGAKGVREFYTAEARLATEHALLDDNGDQLGTPADWFRGVRPVKAAKEGAAVDGLLAARFVLVPSRLESELPATARQIRDELESELSALRQRKSQLSEDEYLRLLEPLLLKLAELYEK